MSHDTLIDFGMCCALLHRAEKEAAEASCASIQAA